MLKTKMGNFETNCHRSADLGRDIAFCCLPHV